MMKRIDPEIGINKLIEEYPQLVEILNDEYGFHCVNCIFSEFDTLKEGAAIHGIEGNDFEEMIVKLEEIINNN